MKYNTLKKIIAGVIGWLSLLLVFIANIVPAFTITSKSDYTGIIATSKVYFVDLFSIGQAFTSSIATIPFYGVLIIILLFICPILILVDKSAIKKVNFGLSLALFSTVVYYARGLKEVSDAITTSNQTFSEPGMIILLIASGLILIGTFYLVIDDIYGEQIKKLMTPVNEKSLIELLEETEKLYKMNVITEEEYKIRRTNLINRGL